MKSVSCGSIVNATESQCQQTFPPLISCRIMPTAMHTKPNEFANLASFHPQIIPAILFSAWLIGARAEEAASRVRAIRVANPGRSQSFR